MDVVKSKSCCFEALKWLSFLFLDKGSHFRIFSKPSSYLESFANNFLKACRSAENGIHLQNWHPSRPHLPMSLSPFIPVSAIASSPGYLLGAYEPTPSYPPKPQMGRECITHNKGHCPCAKVTFWFVQSWSWVLFSSENRLILVFMII